MKMEYVYITPEMANNILQKNGNNRRISKGLVEAYASDIEHDNWDESVGTAISIDENGVLRDGQHRLSAVILANKGIHTWICWNVSSTGIYDNNRKRSNSDQISILRNDLEKVYRSTRYIAIAGAIISHNNGYFGRKVTAKEIIDFTDAHKEILDGFFLKISQDTVSKISVTTVYLSLFMAYVGGVDMSDISAFYEVLCYGMSTRPEEFPIIAYRNYLKDNSRIPVTLSEISRCQYALKKYLVGSCAKNTREMKNLIWPFPFESEAQND
jgi:hypothetical protein